MKYKKKKYSSAIMLLFSGGGFVSIHTDWFVDKLFKIIFIYFQNFWQKSIESKSPIKYFQACALNRVALRLSKHTIYRSATIYLHLVKFCRKEKEQIEILIKRKYTVCLQSLVAMATISALFKGGCAAPHATFHVAWTII